MKAYIHSAGQIIDWERMQEYAEKTSQEVLAALMGDAAPTIVKYFPNKKGIVFIGFFANISLWCDCAGTRAPEPKFNDVGILA